MGNLCCKKQRIQSDLEAESPEIHETESVKFNSETEFVKSKSETESVKSSSYTESVKSNSETESVKSKSETESVKSSSDTGSVKSNSETESVKSSSKTESVKSNSETESVKSSAETGSVKSNSETESVKYSSEIHLDEKHQTDNKLELYLNDVYQKECVIKAPQEEVEFIQTGIETLVQDIVDEVLDLFSTHKETDEIFDKEDNKTDIKKYFENDLIDVYFPIKEGSRFQYLTDIKPAKSSIIKVGSFYEGTRNNFPDEFDFIFPLVCGRGKLYHLSWPVIEAAVYSCLYSINSVTVRDRESAVSSCIESDKNRKSFRHASPNGTREIYLDTDKGIVGPHGPALMLKFIYKNGSTKGRQIAVDLVPAYKIVVINKPDFYVNYVNDSVKPKSFHDEIMSAESCLFVDDYISFTETEVYFIRKVLSRRHVKVYRILKFLINGHGDDETMRECIIWLSMRDIIHLDRYKPYSSYMIKTMMIYHHDECRNSDTTDIGPCVLQVLQEMCKYEEEEDFPAFSVSGGKFGSCLVDDLQSVIKSLKSLQTRTGSYSYEEYKIKSVTRQYLERKHMDWLNKHEKKQHLSE